MGCVKYFLFVQRAVTCVIGLCLTTAETADVELLIALDQIYVIHCGLKLRLQVPCCTMRQSFFQFPTLPDSESEVLELSQQSFVCTFDLSLR